MNFSTLLFNIQENTANLLEDNSTIIETEQISMWQLIWGYDSISGEYSLTSLIVMSLLFIFSFTAIYVFMERFMTIQRALKGKKDFMQKINGTYETVDCKQALEGPAFEIQDKYTKENDHIHEKNENDPLFALMASSCPNFSGAMGIELLGGG